MDVTEKKLLLLMSGTTYSVTSLFIDEYMSVPLNEHKNIIEDDMPIQCRNPSNILEKILYYVELSDIAYRSHFRITKISTEFLCQLLGREWYGAEGEAGRAPVDVNSGIMLGLWYLATKETFREVGDRFGVSRGQAYRILNRFIKLLSLHISQFIKWPSRNDMIETVDLFNNVYEGGSFPGVCGCLDGTHIQIPQPDVNDTSFFNRKGFHSIVLQAVCDSQLYFTDIYVGWPGSVSDARIWRNSPLHQKLTQDPDFILPNTHLLGDKAYPLEMFIMVPFKDNGHLTRAQIKYNTLLSRTRIKIEQAFGHLKNAFRCLQYLNRIKPENMKYVIMSTCILHNIRISEKLPLENLELHIENEVIVEEHLEDGHDAQDKRNYITNIIQ